jgi:hypothetical protein
MSGLMLRIGLRQPADERSFLYIHLLLHTSLLVTSLMQLYLQQPASSHPLASTMRVIQTADMLRHRSERGSLTEV